MTALPRELEGYRDRHRGATMLVAGCGRSVASLASLAARPRCPVIGVNDIGRAFDPDYLVVLNPREQSAATASGPSRRPRPGPCSRPSTSGSATPARCGSGSASAAAGGSTSRGGCPTPATRPTSRSASRG